MKSEHAHTLHGLFCHPLKHDVRMSDVEALLQHLDAEVEHLSEHRLKLKLHSGETMVLHAAPGPKHPFLDADGVLRLRRFLQHAGITPEHPAQTEPGQHIEESQQLVIHMDHRGARLWWMEGEDIETSTLKPHGLWSSHQRLSHRHDRDIAGQRAPLDHDYLNQLCEAVLQADQVLLLGHGHGQSDLRQLLTEKLERQHPDALNRINSIAVDDTACSDKELLAKAKTFFGCQPVRHQPKTPGQPAEEKQDNAE